MFILVIYDVDTTGSDGQKRLRKVAKTCEQYGQRVQNSCFECNVDPAQYAMLKSLLKDAMDEENDSLRFYGLGNNYKDHIEHMGKTCSIAEDDTLIF